MSAFGDGVRGSGIYVLFRQIPPDLAFIYCVGMGPTIKVLGVAAGEEL